MSVPSTSSASVMAKSDDSVTKNMASGIISNTTNESAANILHHNTIAHKMRGIGRKMSRFRSRSAERLSHRNRNGPEREEETEYDASNLDSTLLNYPAQEKDKSYSAITFR